MQLLCAKLCKTVQSMGAKLLCNIWKNWANRCFLLERLPNISEKCAMERIYYILSIAHFSDILGNRSDILGNRSNKKQRFARFLLVLFSPFVANFDQFCTYFVSFCTKPLHNSFVRVGYWTFEWLCSWRSPDVASLENVRLAVDHEHASETGTC